MNQPIIRKRQCELSHERKRRFHTSPEDFPHIATKRLVSFVIFLCVSSWLHSTTWHIKLDGTGNFTSIQGGINASTDNDTVLVYPGTYFENIDFNGKNITVASLELTTGNEQFIFQTIIDGQNQTSCVSIISNETNTFLRGFTITNGQGEPGPPKKGGGVSIYGDNPNIISCCNIINCVINGNSAYSSGGLYVNDADVFLSGCSIRNNYAIYGGGAMSVISHSSVTFDPVNRCNIYNNDGVYNVEIKLSTPYISEFNVIVDTFTVLNPTAYFVGNTYNGTQFTFDILNYTFVPVDHDLYVSTNGNDNNSGLTENDPLKTINLAVRKIASNPESPNTIFLDSGIYDISNNDQRLPFGCKAYVNIIGEDQESTIIDGEMERFSLFTTFKDYSNSLLKNITFRNSHPHSAGIYITKCDYITFKNIIIKDCIVTQFGAGLLGATNCGNIELVNVKVDNIEAQIGGNSGVWINGTSSFKASECTFSNNTISGGPCYSAGLYVDCNGDIVIENCKFINNSGSCPTYFGYASALLVNDYNGEIGDVYINNNLFLDNHIENGRGTIYIDSEPNSSIHFSNNTVVDNISSYGVSFNGNMYLQNNILRNPGDYEVGLLYDPYLNFHSTLYSSYNDIEGGPNAIFSDNNLNVINWQDGNIDEDPQFLLSGDDPYQLTEFSSCIDNGTPDTTGLFLPPWDLLHHGRIWDGDNNGEAIIDMGCYEFGADSVGVTNHQLPMTSSQMTNYPNPFNPSTTISFNLSESGKVKVEIFNIKGQMVKTLMDCTTAPGNYKCVWNGKNDAGKSVSSGEYFARLKVNGEEIDVRKMLLLK